MLYDAAQRSVKGGEVHTTRLRSEIRNGKKWGMIRHESWYATKAKTQNLVFSRFKVH